MEYDLSTLGYVGRGLPYVGAEALEFDLPTWAYVGHGLPHAGEDAMEYDLSTLGYVGRGLPYVGAEALEFDLSGKFEHRTFKYRTWNYILLIFIPSTAQTYVACSAGALRSSHVRLRVAGTGKGPIGKIYPVGAPTNMCTLGTNMCSPPSNMCTGCPDQLVQPRLRL